MEEMTKTCSKCKRELPVSEFQKTADRKSGLRSQCKECTGRGRCEQYAANPEKYKELSRKNRKDYPKTNRVYCIKNADKIKINRHKRYGIHKEKINEKRRVYYAAHRKEINERQRVYNAKNPEKLKDYRQKQYSIHGEKLKEKIRIRRITERQKCFEHYGYKCACCGEDKYEFLVFDHINGGGSKHRKEIKMDISTWLIKNNFPEGFRVLCHNCNSALGHFGYCPHTTTSIKTIVEEI